MRTGRRAGTGAYVQGATALKGDLAEAAPQTIGGASFAPAPKPPGSDFDGRTLGVPSAWFPRLLYATPEQRELVEIGRMGLHWEELDEDISVAGLLAGRGDRTKWGRRERKRAANSAA